MKIIKLKIVAIFSLLAFTAYADSGLYMGIDAGYGTINTTTTNGYTFTNGSGNQNGGNMVGGLFVGYDFSRYVGAQFDYNYIANVQYTGGSTNGVTSSFSANQQILDLGVVGHLPFDLFANSLSGLSIFGKAAIGYAFTNFNGGNVQPSSNSNMVTALPGSSSNIVPVLGVGVEYGINSVGVRVEYDYVGNNTINNNGQNLANTSDNLFLLSVLYHF